MLNYQSQLTRKLPALSMSLSPALQTVAPRSLFHFSPAYQQPTIASTPRSASSCPSCGAHLPSAIVAVCPGCNSILPPPHPSTSHYDLFGLEPTFAIDQPSLKQSFLKYQQKVHPDMFAGEGEKETWAKLWSRQINDAFRILEKNLSRGEYLVSVLVREF